MDIDKESLDKGQQSRGVRAVSQGHGGDRNLVGTQKVEREALIDLQT